MVEETTPTNKHSPSVDEVGEFADECSFLWDMRVANALTRPIVYVAAVGRQWARPEKSARTPPASVERRLFPDTRITAYRLGA